MSLRSFIVFGIGRLIPDKLWIQIKYLNTIDSFLEKVKNSPDRYDNAKAMTQEEKMRKVLERIV